MIYGLFSLSVLLCATVLNSMGADENKHEFHEMCKIYTLLSTKPEDPRVVGEKEKIDPLAETQKIWEEIELYNISTGSKALYDLIKEKGTKEGLNGSVPGVNEISEDQWKRYHEKFKGVNAKVDAYGRGGSWEYPQSERLASKAHALIGRMRVRAQVIKGQIEGIVRDERCALGEAREKLFAALFGEAAVSASWGEGAGKVNADSDWSQYPVTTASFASGGHNEACKGAQAGMSLVSDLCCLCGKKTGANNENVCAGGDLSSKDYNGNAAQAPARWGVLRGACTGLTAKGSLGVPTAASLRAAVASFKALLGKNWVVHSSAPTTNKNDGMMHILGRFVVSDSGAVDCSGDGLSGGQTKGVCVTYKDVLGKGEIPWVKNTLDAAAELDKAAKKGNQISGLLARLEAARTTAEAAYEEAFWDLSSSGNQGAADTPSTSAAGANGNEQLQKPISVDGQPNGVQPHTLLNLSGTFTLIFAILFV